MKKPIRNMLLIALCTGGLIVLLALTAELSTLTTTDLTVVAPDFTTYLCCLAIALPAFFLIAGLVFGVLYFLNRETVRTALHIAAHRISSRIATKNAATIYPCVQQFLFFVLSQNREFLHLPLGKDASCLAPCGYVTAYRSGCVFYRFLLVAPEKPDKDFPVLRQIIQSYIITELQNYGIAGLSAVFQSKAVGTMPTVFLDRLYYDEGMHQIGFDILCIDNENAAMYARNAVMRDAAPKQQELEVTDADF